MRASLKYVYEETLSDPESIGAYRILELVATGGMAGRVANESTVIDRVEPFLTLEGLRIIFEKNRPPDDGSQKEKSG